MCYRQRVIAIAWLANKLYAIEEKSKEVHVANVYRHGPCPCLLSSTTPLSTVQTLVQCNDNSIRCNFNINYINNDDIDNSLLNGSNLHLNKAGDKALGGAFCSFLKSSRPINTRQVPSRNNQRFFHQTGRHTTQWTEYLMFVSQVLRN